MCTGCGNNDNLVNDENDGINITKQSEENGNKEKDSPKEIKVVPNQKPTFDEVFSQVILNNPQLFLEQFVKGF